MSRFYRSLLRISRWRSMCFRSVLAVTAATGALASTDPAIGQHGDSLADGSPLYLAVSVNGVEARELVSVEQTHSGLAIEVALLRKLGLRFHSGESRAKVLLREIQGLVAEYEPRRQRLSITVPVGMLDRPVARLAENGPEPATLSEAAAGLLVNYDVFANRAQDAESASGWGEIRAFGVGPGTWTNSAVVRATHGPDGLRVTATRLDSYWQLNWPSEMISLVAGDTATRGPSWTRPVRIGGVRLSSNFSLQPYRPTAPLASFVGQATLPSAVDLYLDGLKRSSYQVLPGQFQLALPPTLNGAGVAQVVVTDMNGQRRTIDVDFYGAPALLQSGLSDWSAEVGFVRKNYGIRSSDYDKRPAISASWRKGLTDNLTVETHAEGQGALAHAGAGVVLGLPSQRGVFSASGAISSSSGVLAPQVAFGYQYSDRWRNISASVVLRSREHRDIASTHETDMLRASFAGAWGFDSFVGRWSLALVGQRYADRPTVRHASINWTHEFGGRSMLTVTLNKKLGESQRPGVYAVWTMPLEGRKSVSVTMAHQEGRGSALVDVVQPTSDSVAGWGWRIQSAVDRGVGANAQVTKLETGGQWSAGISRSAADKETFVYGSASGSLVWTQGQFAAMRSTGDALALVSTGEFSDIPVRLENRPVGRTNADGVLLVPRLNAYQHNKLSIDTSGLPADVRVDEVTADAVPENRSAAFVKFHLRRVSGINATLRDEAGEFVPAGSLARLIDRGGNRTTPSTISTVIGYDGALYLEDVSEAMQLRVETHGGFCTVDVPRGRNMAITDHGTLICKREVKEPR